MAAPSKGPSLPLFVPRTVTASERTATRIARRHVSAGGPGRSVGLRAISWADRVVSGWLTGTPRDSAERPTAGASLRAGGLVMPRPWYEIPEEPLLGLPIQWSEAPAAVPARAPVTVAERAAPADSGVAERGAAIARTPLALPSEAAAPTEARAARNEQAAAVTASEGSRPIPDVVRAPATEAPPVRAAEPAPIRPREVATVAGTETAEMRAAEPPLAPGPDRQGVRSQAEADEPRAYEALGLTTRAAAVAPPPSPVALQPRPISAVVRALHHAEWVDTQLRTLSARAAAVVAEPSAASASAPGYVWVAPAQPEAARAERERSFTTEAIESRAAESPRQSPSPSPSVLRPPTPVVFDAQSPPATRVSAAPAVERTATPIATRATVSMVALPELRLDGALGTPGLSASVIGTARFLERLVGWNAARDVEALPLPSLKLVSAQPDARIGERFAPRSVTTGVPEETSARPFERAPGMEYVRLPESAREGSPTAERTASFEALSPRAAGAAGADAEPARFAPVATGAPAVSPTVILGAPTFDRSAHRPGGLAVEAERFGGVLDARGQAAWGGAESPPPARQAPPMITLASPGGEERREREPDAIRPGPARNAQFIDRLVGVETAYAATPLPVIARVPMLSAPASPTEQGGTAGSDVPEGDRPAASGRAATTRAEQTAVLTAALRENRIAARAPDRPPLVATLPAAPSGEQPASRAPIVRDLSPPSEKSGAQPARQFVAATGEPRTAARPTAAGNALLRPGGIGIRAEQLGGLVGVRAASLSLEFVDPAGLPALTSGRASPELSYLRLPSASPSNETVARAPGQLAAAGGRSTFAATEGAALSADEWALVATFPSTATAMQMVSARRGGQWAPGPIRERAVEAPARTFVAPAGGASAGNVASVEVAARRSEGPLALRAAERALAGLRETNAAGAATSSGATLAESASAVARASRAPAPQYLSLGSAGGERHSLPGGRQPRGSFTWPGAARFAPSSGEPVSSPTMAAAQAAADAAPGTPLWGAMRPLVTTNGAPVERARPRATSRATRVGGELPANDGLALARPFLELVRGGLSPTETGPAAREAIARYGPQAQPLVHATGAGDSATRMMEAVRQQPSTPGDDRVTLADLTLISVASASQQVAASPAGGSPSTAAARPPAGASPASPAGKHEGGKGAASPAEIDDLAHKVFSELQRLLEIARERSGDPWES